MRHPKLFAGILVLGVLLTGCSRHPKVDFSVPTESTEPVTTTASETQPMTFKPPEEEKGFDSADAAYQAYLKAVEAQDVEAFCGLFNEEEVRSAKNVPSKFLKNWFNVRQEADYKSYLTRTNPENFQKMVAANFNSYQSAMSAFGAPRARRSSLWGSPAARRSRARRSSSCASAASGSPAIPASACRMS